MGHSGPSDAEVVEVHAADDASCAVGEVGLEMGGVGPRVAPGVEFSAADGTSCSVGVGGLETGGVGPRDTQIAPAASWVVGAELEAGEAAFLGPFGGPNFVPGGTFEIAAVGDFDLDLKTMIDSLG